jgi:hypothetical protein
MLKSHVEKEIKDSISARMKKCFDDLETNFKKKGFVVDLQRNDYDVGLIVGKVRTTIDYDLSLTKGATDRYDKFVVEIDSGLQRLVSIANNLLSGEAEFGETDISKEMDLNYWLKAEKKKQTDGTKIYILTDKENEEVFMFASRSIAYPLGF